MTLDDPNPVGWGGRVGYEACEVKIHCFWGLCWPLPKPQAPHPYSEQLGGGGSRHLPPRGSRATFCPVPRSPRWWPRPWSRARAGPSLSMGESGPGQWPAPPWGDHAGVGALRPYGELSWASGPRCPQDKPAPWWPWGDTPPLGDWGPKPATPSRAPAWVARDTTACHWVTEFSL